jgi:hypothetical protein
VIVLRSAPIVLLAILPPPRRGQLAGGEAMAEFLGLTQGRSASGGGSSFAPSREAQPVGLATACN